MNYDHAFHAGNFADVIKHLALVAVLLHLRRKDKPFCVIDTHAGAGKYNLGSDAAVRTGEAAGGIGRLGALRENSQLPEAIRTYLASADQEGEGCYPGSARLAARLLRPQDRLVAIEKCPETAKALSASLAGFANSHAIQADGYERLPALLPPHERRGVILVDPPYEAEDEFARVTAALARAHRRFATGIYLVWYPIKSRGSAKAFLGEIAARGIAPLTLLEIDVGRPLDANKDRLAAAGLLVVNPPFGFADEMRKVATVLAPLLGHSRHEPATVRLVSPPT